MTQLPSKTQYLEKLQGLVNTFQQQIEDTISGILEERFELGDIVVRDLRKFPIIGKTLDNLKDCVDIAGEEIKESWPTNSEGAKRFFHTLITVPIIAIAAPIYLWKDCRSHWSGLKDGIAVYYDSAIYANTSSHILQSDTAKSPKIDRTMVHELSHALLEKLRKTRRLPNTPIAFNEAFADYCDTVFFRDLHSTNRESLMPGYWVEHFVASRRARAIKIETAYRAFVKEVERKGNRGLIDLALEE